jgi:hypothetical protein
MSSGTARASAFSYDSPAPMVRMCCNAPRAAASTFGNNSASAISTLGELSARMKLISGAARR